MLLSLRVQNLAIVEDILLSLQPGLNVITGETGAGKSIIVGALTFILGERANKSIIRTGEEQCAIEAVFHLPDPEEINELLEELGITPCEEGRLILRRIINSSGSGRNIINDCPSTLQTLDRVGTLLVDMHGPHEHQSLLNHDFQTNLVDSFGHLWKFRSSYEDSYNRFIELQNSRRILDADDQTVAQQIDLYSFQIREIEDAKLSPGEDIETEKEHAMSANSAQILQLSSSLQAGLTEGETSAFQLMTQMQQQLAALTRMVPDTEDLRKEAQSITVQIQELSASINRKFGDVDCDPARLQWLDDRLALLAKFKRKYGGTLEKVLEVLETAKSRLNDLQDRGRKIGELDASIEKENRDLSVRAKRLTDERTKAAKVLSAAITAELKGLGFPHGVFNVKVTPGEPAKSGADLIAFEFAPNPGETMRPLAEIASSGEISRVMLATKTILAQHDRIPVLVFDEIDANVGGEMGNAIGKRLRSIAAHHQVLCITHLPQVAVSGSTHFIVTKKVTDGRTKTAIEQADQEARVEEIARMLGGRDTSSVVLRHAREMLESISGKSSR
jgi:DNA repair protein RecN (Recombination protein N)